MRTTVGENKVLGRWVGEKLGRARGPVALILPLRGFSQYDREGGVFWDPAADEAFRRAARGAAGGRVEIITVDANINDLEFAQTAVATLLRLVDEAKVRGR